MDSLTFIPPQSLEPYVKYTAFVETSGGGTDGQKTFIPVVDGCPGIIIQDKEYGILARNGKKLSSSFLFGQSTRYSELTLQGEFKAICVYLKPHALRSLFGLNAASLTDSCVDLTSISKGNELAKKLDDATTRQGKIDLVNRYLMKNLNHQSNQDDSLINYVLEKIISLKGICSLRDLQAEVHLSERSFERRFKHHVGISAKLFSRICRFQSAFKQLGKKDFKDLTGIAFENDYADQSHFIKAFKEFAGFPPLQYQKKSERKAENLSEILL